MCIHHVEAEQSYVLDKYTEVYGLGRASHWRSDGRQLAFTTTCAKSKPAVRELVVLDCCGRTLVDSSILKGLAGLEFICYSPKGGRIAALRPAEPGAGGRAGGTLVEIDLESPGVRDVGEISAAVACNYVDSFEKLVAWDEQDHCRPTR